MGASASYGCAPSCKATLPHDDCILADDEVKKDHGHRLFDTARPGLDGVSCSKPCARDEDVDTDSNTLLRRQQEAPWRMTKRASTRFQLDANPGSPTDEPEAFDGWHDTGAPNVIMGIVSRVAPNLVDTVSRVAPALVSTMSRAPTTHWNHDDEDAESEAPSSNAVQIVDEDDEHVPMTVSRVETKRKRTHLRLINTLGNEASTRMQLIIENPRKLQDFYELGKPIGKGGFAIVRQARVKATGAQRAVKAMVKAKMRTHMEILRKEIEITKMVDHPSIIKLYEIFEDGTNLYLVMELCQGGHLQDRLLKVGRFTDKASAAIMLQIFRAVYYLHKHFIVHRDLKSENCLLSTREPVERNTVKVADFGLACMFTPGQHLTMLAGTTSYMAPEVLKKSYSNSCDLWSCGVMLYCFLCGYLPFVGKDELDVTEKILAVRFNFVARDWVDSSNHSTELVRALLTKEPRRLTARQALQHPFITENAKPKDTPIETSLLRNLRTFRSQNKFKKAALHIVASQLKEKQLMAPIQAFMSADIDGDGTLSPAELEAKLKANARYRDHRNGFQNAVESIFKEGDQIVDFTFTEFLAATFDRQRYCRTDVCKAAFSVFDQNGDGTLSKEELVCGRFFGTLSPEELHKLVEDLDDNGDGKIDFDEFYQMMRADLKFRPKIQLDDEESATESDQESLSSATERVALIRKKIAARKAARANEALGTLKSDGRRRARSSSASSSGSESTRSDVGSEGGMTARDSSKENVTAAPKAACVKAEPESNETVDQSTPSSAQARKERRIPSNPKPTPKHIEADAKAAASHPSPREAQNPTSPSQRGRTTGKPVFSSIPKRQSAAPAMDAGVPQTRPKKDAPATNAAAPLTPAQGASAQSAEASGEAPAMRRALPGAGVGSSTVPKARIVPPAPDSPAQSEVISSKAARRSAPRIRAAGPAATPVSTSDTPATSAGVPREAVATKPSASQQQAEAPSQVNVASAPRKKVAGARPSPARRAGANPAGHVSSSSAGAALGNQGASVSVDKARRPAEARDKSSKSNTSP